MNFLQNHIEALVFCSPTVTKVADLKACLSEMFNADVPEEDIEAALQRIDQKFQSEEFSFQLFKAAGGYQFLTKPAYQASIGIMLKQQSKKRLSTSAMETLSIIAYKQPISKTEVENIRGVNCDYAIQKLLDKGLIEIQGKAETIGRPILYGTSPKFMEYFGINDITELPTPKDFTIEVNTIGETPDNQ
ncbi:MAG: SMC-Scp complex subunit ScpB [Flammeovirgaceae bacterium]